ncbi:exopolysaccharide regulatory tyrosine autokinase VpsO [Alteraurantiacibacter aestuarii]
MQEYAPGQGHANAGRSEEFAAAQPALAQINLADIRGIFWRQRYVLIGVVALVMLGAFVYTLLTPATYRASVTMQIEPNQQAIIEGQELTGTSIASNDITRYMETMAAVIRSRNVGMAVVDELGLTSNQSFMESVLDEGVTVASGDMAKDAAVETIMSEVEVAVPLENRVMTISYTSRDPAIAAQIANGYADAFLAYDLTRSMAANQYAREYLQEQIVSVREQLQDAEQRANNYARNNRIFGSPASDDGEGPAASTVSASNLSAANTVYAQTRSARIAAQQRWLAIANVPAGQLPEIQQNATVLSLQAQRAELLSQLTTLRERYRDDYPEVRELIVRTEVLQQQIDSAAADIKAGIRRQYEIAQRQESALGGELERVAGLTLDEQDSRVAYNVIEREVQSYRDQMAALLDRFNDISAASNIQAREATILDRAMVPGAPSAPNLSQNLLVALILGIGLAVVVAILREFLDDRLRNIEDVERKLGLRPLGTTPDVSGDVQEAVTDTFSPLSESYASLRATLDYAIRDIPHPVILVTSGQAVEGKTTSSTALARKYAGIGKRVLLVDMDLRRPAVAKVFDLPRRDAGVVEVIYGNASLDQTVVKDVVKNLDILPIGTLPSNPIEILSSGLTGEFLDKCRQAYDVIILDGSPILGIADAPLLSRYVDGVVVVVEANNIHSRQARAAIRRLNDARAPILGALLTKYRALDAGDNYAYQYEYYSYGKAGD